MRNQQLGVALMLVLPFKAALGVLLRVEPAPMLVAINFAIFVFGLVIYLRANNDTTD